MKDDLLVKELLEEQVPLRADGEPDWTDVLHRAGPNSSRPRVRRRRLLVPVLVAVVVLVAGVAIAAALDGVPWWEGAPPPENPGWVNIELARGSGFPPPADRSKARTVATADDGSSLVAAPISTGGYCLLPYIPGEPGIDAPCVYGAGDEDEIYASARPMSSGQPRWMLYGRILKANAAVFDLSSAAGFPFRIPLYHGGFFIANVPRERWRALSNQAGAGKIVDRSGSTLSTGCVNWGPGPIGAHAEETGYDFWRDDWRASVSHCRPESRPPSDFSIEFADFAAAKKLVELRLGASYSVWKAGDTIATWIVPTRGGVCVMNGLASPPPTGRGDLGGGYCAPKLQEHTYSGSIGVSFGAGLQGSVYRWMITGFVDPESGIEHLELRSAEGNVPLGFAHNHFLAQLPHTSNSGDELPPGGPYLLIGYDHDGKEIARVDLEKEEQRYTTVPGGG